MRRSTSRNGSREIPPTCSPPISASRRSCSRNSRIRTCSSPARVGPANRTPVSNHKESMGGVAAELFDQAEFPIEIGLHRAGIDIGALIGTPVALRRIGLWHNFRRTNFQRAVIAAFEHVHFPAHLRE